MTSCEHDGLVAKIARSYRWGLSAGLSWDDLMQAGRLGVEAAKKRFRPDLGFRFTTYAQFWIRAYVAREIEANTRTIRLPGHVYQRLRGKLPPREASLDAGIPGLDAVTLGERMSDDAPDAIDAIDEIQRKKRVRDAVARLPERVRTVVELRFLRELPLDEVARRMPAQARRGGGKRGPLSRERIRQLEAEGLRQLRAILEEESGREVVL